MIRLAKCSFNKNCLRNWLTGGTGRGAGGGGGVKSKEEQEEEKEDWEIEEEQEEAYFHLGYLPDIHL